MAAAPWSGRTARAGAATCPTGQSGARPALVETAGPDAGSSLMFAELRHLGGAYARPAARPSATSTVDGEFLLLGVGLDHDPSAWPGLHDDTRHVLRAMAPWTSPRAYLPMVDDEVDARSGWQPDAWTRLRAVRAAADPDQLFVAGQVARE